MSETNTEELFEQFESILVNSTNAPESFRRICQLCSQAYPDEVWDEIRGLEIESDIARIEDWAKELFSKKPPHKEVNAFWFGLQDDLDDDGLWFVVFYVGGTQDFDPEDTEFHWTELPQWLPPEGEIPSEVIRILAERVEEIHTDAVVEEIGDWNDDEVGGSDEIEELELQDEELASFSLSSMLLNFGVLGYAALVAGHLCRTLDPKLLLGDAPTRVVAVGFDEGDGIILGEITPDGWHASDIYRD